MRGVSDLALPTPVISTADPHQGVREEVDGLEERNAPVADPPPLPTSYLRNSIQKSRYRTAHVLSSDLDADWTTRDAHSLHALVPRLGGFPPSLARWAIQKYSEPGQTVLDPFAGKGTAPLEALLIGRNAIGADAAPDAFVITHAKTSGVTHAAAADLLDVLDTSSPWSLDPVPSAVRTFFEDQTLREILALRHLLFTELGIEPGRIESLSQSRPLSHRRRVALYVMACLLGCLHGPVNWGRNKKEKRVKVAKDHHQETGLHPQETIATSLYLSVHCNHTYSASPVYVRRYCEEHGLVPPRRNVAAAVLRKSALAQKDGVPDLTGHAIYRRAESLRLRRGADLVVTSPPYFRAQTYAWDNWLRLWCLGYPDYRTVARTLLHTESVRLYYEGMRSSLRRIHQILRGPGARAVLVVGDVRTRQKGKLPFLREDERLHRYVTLEGAKSMINTSEVIADIASSEGFAVELIVNDTIPRGDRALASYLGPQQGTDIDRAVVLRRL